MGSACYPWLQETHGAQVSCPVPCLNAKTPHRAEVVDIAGLPKALCNNAPCCASFHVLRARFAWRRVVACVIGLGLTAGRLCYSRQA